MSKRKRVLGGLYSSSNEVITFPPLEATILLETGGNTPYNAGNTSHIPLSADLGGVQKLVYNDPFFNNDFFETTIQNSLIGLLVSCFQNSSYRSCVVPICLPRQAIGVGEFTSHDDYVKVQKSIAYGLNLFFSKELIVISNPGFETIGINEASMPICQTNVLPPLVWDVLPRTGQLVLRKNEAYVPAATDFQIAFQLFSIRQNIVPKTGDLYEIAGESNGFIGKGGTLYGFGILNVSTSKYEDVYKMETNSFFDTLKLKLTTVLATFVTDWDQQIVEPLYLTKSLLMGSRTLSCHSSRFYLLKSKQLSHHQRRAIYTASGETGYACIAIIYNLPNKSCIYQDGVQLLIDPSIMNYSSNRSIDSVDIYFEDENGDSQLSTSSTWLYGNQTLEDTSFSLGSIPAAYQAIDPYGASNAPRHDCLFPYGKMNQNYTSSKIPYPNYSLKPSASITHFIRCIGS